MRVSTVARVVRIPVFAAAVVAPLLVAACGNPMAPREASRVSDAAPGGTQPWYDEAPATLSGGTQPWYKTSAATTSGGTQPWYKSPEGQNSGDPAPAQISGGTQPWY